jgi:cytochrome c553
MMFKQKLSLLLLGVFLWAPALSQANEYLDALYLEGDPGQGKKTFATCKNCHTAEGWGSKTGDIPQIAGQHTKVIIRQIYNFYVENRHSSLMTQYSAMSHFGDSQGLADVASYISALPMITNPVHGDGKNLKRGKSLYNTYCAKFCHGRNGEGHNAKAKPRIQGQHYVYLLNQLKAIRDGERKAADKGMLRRMQKLDDQELEALADFISRIKPDEKLLAPLGWKNPDFQ